MRNNRTLLCGLLILAFSSCKRLDGETVVEGKVVDRHTGEAIPHATVGIYKNISNAVWGGYTLDFEKKADGKGNFSFSFEGNNKKNYSLLASTDKGGYTIWQEAISISQGRNNKKLKLKMQSPAWLKVKLVNQLPKDTIWMYFTSLGVKDYNLHMLMRDTAVTGLVSGNETRQIYWEFINSKGQKVKESKQFYFPALDTTDLVIQY